MIASRTEGERALVRIHDEYCESEPEAWLPRLNKIVTDAYRRFLEGRFRKAFDLVGTPLRVEMKTARNPYAEKDS